MILEKIFFDSVIGEVFMNILGIISVASSIAFVILTYTDWSRHDPNCTAFYEVYDVWILEDEDTRGPPPEDTSNPKCLEFFYSRMPPIYESIDMLCALVYLFNYFINLLLSPNRCQYFISAESEREEG